MADANANPGHFVGILESLKGIAAGRNYISFASGICLALASVGFLDPEQQKVLLDGINQVMEGLGKVSAGLLAVFPVITLIAARFAGVAASIFGRTAAINAEAEKTGLRLIVADDSKVAPLAAALPGLGVTLAPPLQPVKVTVPQPAPEEKAKTLSSMFAVPLIIILALPLGGCDAVTWRDAWNAAVQIAGQYLSGNPELRKSLLETRNVIARGCNAIGYAEQEAYTRSQTCGTKVSKLRAGVEAICMNQSLLTDDIVGNYAVSVARAVKSANAACPK